MKKLLISLIERGMFSDVLIRLGIRRLLRKRLQHVGNVAVETADMNNFETKRRFDRILSIEMFEHMRNWEKLMSRISEWLNQEGPEARWSGHHYILKPVLPAKDN